MILVFDSMFRAAFCWPVLFFLGFLEMWKSPIFIHFPGSSLEVAGWVVVSKRFPVQKVVNLRLLQKLRYKFDMPWRQRPMGEGCGVIQWRLELTPRGIWLQKSKFLNHWFCSPVMGQRSFWGLVDVATVQSCRRTMTYWKAPRTVARYTPVIYCKSGLVHKGASDCK